MNNDLTHPRDQLVATMSRIYRQGMTTLSGGNLSIKDSDGDIWITPAGIDKGLLTAMDIMQVSPGGAISGRHRPSSELPFHRAIYAARPDVRAIVHAHAPALVSFSIARQMPDTSVLPQVARLCDPVGYAPYALTGSDLLGERIAETFAAGHDIVILENHGAVAVGETLLEAFARLEALELAARTLIRAAALGEVHGFAAQQADDGKVWPEFVPAGHGSRERELRRQIADVLGRAYERGMVSAATGTLSARLDDGRFLISPADQDRALLGPQDIVLLAGGRVEAGKAPSEEAALHEAIYAAQPEIKAIITGGPPNATAYAITAVPFDTRTIPESYVLLRGMPFVPAEIAYGDPAAVAKLVSPRTPVLLLGSRGVLAAGSDILNAYDRLEVAEFSARSLLDTAVIGPMQPIGAAEIGALEEAFGLS
jgi:L-fuculose-phosphate aldolase